MDHKREHKARRAKLPPAAKPIERTLAQPIRSDALSLIEKLPVDVIQYLAAFLTLDTAALLALCSQTLATKLGTQYWVRIRPLRLTHADFNCGNMCDAWFGMPELSTEGTIVADSHEQGTRSLLYRSCGPYREDGCPHAHAEYRPLVDFFGLLQRDLPPGWYFCAFCTCLHYAQFDAVPPSTALCGSYLLQPVTPYAIPLYDDFAITINLLPMMAARLRIFGADAPMVYPRYYSDNQPPDKSAMEADVEPRLSPGGHVLIRTQEWLRCDQWEWKQLAYKSKPTLQNAIEVLGLERGNWICPHLLRHPIFESHCEPVTYGETVHFLCRECPTEVQLDFWKFRQLFPQAERKPIGGLTAVLTVWKDLGPGCSLRESAWRAHMLETSHHAYPMELAGMGWQEPHLGFAHPATRYEQQPGTTVEQLEQKLLKAMQQIRSDSTLAHRGYRPLVKMRFPGDWPIPPTQRWTRPGWKQTVEEGFSIWG